MIDTDNSGTTTLDELKDGLKRVRSELMDLENKALMDADGQIDYGEFAAMMKKGNGGGVGKRTTRNSLNFNLDDVLKTTDALIIPFIHSF